MESSFFKDSSVRNVVFTGDLCISCGKGKELNLERYV